MATGSDTYYHGTSVTLTATPNADYRFTHWMESGSPVSTDATYTFNATAARTLVANFVQTYTVTATTDPPEGGTAAGSDTYDHGASATLTATPNVGYDFVNWTKDGTEVSTNATYTFTVTEAHTLVAHFTLKTYDISVSANPPEYGTASGNHTNIPHGTSVTVEATPNTGYYFVNWTENGVEVSTVASYTFIAMATRTLVANFTPPHNINVLASPPEGGTVSGNRTNIPHRASVTVEATPNTSYYFVNWTENGVEVSTNATYTFTATASRTLVANFALLYDINVSANPPEGGTVSGGGANILYGTSATVTATPTVGYYFVNWMESGSPGSTNATYTFIVTASCTLVANFTLKTYTVTFVDWNGAELKTEEVKHGSAATAPEDPTRREGYHFTGWDVPFNNITGNLTITAQYTINTYNVTVSANSATYGTVAGGGAYTHGTSVTITATPNNCYRFANWTINGVEVSTNNPYEFTIQDNVELVANFYDLNFETYSPALWYNTFMLDLRKLEEDGYEITGCRWFKNGIEETDTHTIDAYSYSAGPNNGDLLESTPTWYMFQITTKNFGDLCSSRFEFPPRSTAPVGIAVKQQLIAYPNPVSSGSPFTLEGVTEGSQIRVYNSSGILVKSAVATGSATTLTLALPSGMYVIRVDNKGIKIIVTQ